MRLNYYYNFKNTIRFFMDIENLEYPDFHSSKGILSWSSPFSFRIRKDENSFRTLKIPNILNFKIAYDYYKERIEKLGYDFEKLECLDIHKRMEIDYELGEFLENSYDKWQLMDYEGLIKYDTLLRYDIKSYYDNIYTHYIFERDTKDKNIDKPLSHLNNGRTGGIIMGNYISLFVAEVISKQISEKLEMVIKSNGVNCDYSYFSDDFYLFVDNKDVNVIRDIFDEVLEEFGLERNIEKIKSYNYLEYTNEDKIEKYWKKISRECKNQQFKQNKALATGKLKKDNNLFFTNQLIYRLNKLNEYKKKKVFIINFFKSKFFRCIPFDNTYLAEYNYHQILYLIKSFPEIILYIDSIIYSFDDFQSKDFINMICNFYINSLKSNYHDEQLYFFYMLYKLDAKEKIRTENNNDMVIRSNNSVLISYYIKEKMFDEREKEVLKEKKDDSYWLVYYYLIMNDLDLFLNLEGSINYYLIPKTANAKKIKEIYKKFYYDNISQKKDILVDLDKIENVITEYFKKKDEVKH